MHPDAEPFLLDVARSALGEEVRRRGIDEVPASDAASAGGQGEGEAPTPEQDASFQRSRFAYRFHGCLLGGAVGDALGARIAFTDLATIREKYGPDGFVDPGGFREHVNHATSNTQMALFTVSGLITAYDAARESDPVIARQTMPLYAYLGWLHTQGTPWRDLWPEPTRRLVPEEPSGWLVREPALHARRNPNPTCLAALREFGQNNRRGSLDHPLNNARDAGAAVRSAPVALWSDSPSEVFRVAAELAVLTHGHPTAYLSAAAFAVICHVLLRQESLPAAIQEAREHLRVWRGHEETLAALDEAVRLAAGDRPTPERIEERLGSGESAEQALGIAVCAALSCPDSYADAVVMAANHSGRSDYSAALCGSLMGAQHDVVGIPWQWWEPLDLRFLVDKVAHDVTAVFGYTFSTPDRSRRPVEHYLWR
ncbi:ADP-ribosylglycohydrolase family protein [Streptoalloteichus tenebrarius]|uniref:ADP-ribosylglycohydrolase family protein n=1 Tax=Streptoalloteichus tenebrarius (strain ATCC 17920 / DSM 40477 / JCM 4838 / CBS 697.72 / NBRC 16177 / NCIMB 11028 / NRRL B-12390 / A12253. 1 / ISP 5477) TaxID=1933 RepID=UPI0020A46B65|nr:ADP-ribosylglycohydrolase family protein [Streptoalloteichus tenebrarius]